MEYTYDNFLCFMLLEAAHADDDFAPEEKQMIVQKVGQETFDKVSAAYNGMSDFERMETIASGKDHMSTEEKRQQILADVKAVFLADDKYLPVEQAVMQMFERVL